jgi:hypothetical protein
MTCTDCHDGFRRFPHGADADTTTKQCGSCHADVRASWGQGIHALDSTATCTACHGTHNVKPLAVLHTPEGARIMRAACGACHYEPASATPDPHADSVSCAGCHEPHRTLPPEDEQSSVNVVNQSRTCGTCHAQVASAWSSDSHGKAVAALATPGAKPPAGGEHVDPPACSACHGAHGMLVPSQPDFGAAMVQRCGACHEGYEESFADSYHGQANTLGSPIVATCASCHGSHGILPSSDTASMVNPDHVLQTCQSCHQQATAGFALFQPHADHNDRDRYPYVYWSYHLMTLLLTGTFLLFGTHTVLWLARLTVDALKGTSHRGHHDAGGAS